MEQLFNIIAQLAFELPPERIEFLAEKIKALPYASEIDKVKKSWGQNYDSAMYSSFRNEVLKAPDMTGRELATAFLSALASAQYSRTNGRVELLWTGPHSSATSVRQIEQAFCDLAASAKRQIFIVSFVAYKADNIINALADAMMRNVAINFLLEPSKEQGGSIDADSIAALQNHLPSAHFFVWDKTKNPDSAVVHAKCVVADEDIAIISSANLTGKAMSSNMELGVLVSGGSIPRQLATHLNGLVAEKIIHPVNPIPDNPLSQE